MAVQNDEKKSDAELRKFLLKARCKVVAKRLGLCFAITFFICLFKSQPVNLVTPSLIAFSAAIALWNLIRVLETPPYTEQEISNYGLRDHINRISSLIWMGMKDMSLACAYLNFCAAATGLFPKLPEWMTYFIQEAGLVFMFFLFIYLAHNARRIRQMQQDILVDRCVPFEV